MKKNYLRIKKDAAAFLISDSVDYAALPYLYMLFQVNPPKKKSSFNKTYILLSYHSDNETTSRVFTIHCLIST